MVVRNRYNAIKASHDVSKLHTVSRFAWRWIDMDPPAEAFVVTTAPTTAQVDAILWRYIGSIELRKGSFDETLRCVISPVAWWARTLGRRPG